MDDSLKAQLRAQIAAIEAGGVSGVSDFECSEARYNCVKKPLRCASEEDVFTAASEEVSLVSQNRINLPSLQDKMDAKECLADEQQRAFRKIERVAALREQASAALRVRLVREGFSAQAIDSALERACACGLVDDARYADVLVRSRMSQGCGVQGIEAELSRLGIDISVVRGWPEDFSIDHDSEVERALALLNRKPPRAKNQRNAAYARLVRKGFGSSVASTAARYWAEPRSE